MAKIFLTSLLVCILFFTYYAPVFSQGPALAPSPPITPVLPQSPALPPAPPTIPVLPLSPALTPAPPGPTNVIKILQKGGIYTTFIRLLRSTQMANQLTIELRTSDQGLTIFVPTDGAFNSLKPGMLNSLSDQQKYELIQFHVLPSFYSASQFQTASNPLRTQAGGGTGQFPLNVTTIGNSVNITSDMVNTSITNTIYTDGNLAVYQVDKVLLSHALFEPPPPAPAPLKPKNHPSTNSTDASPVLTSDGIRESKCALSAISSVVLIVGAVCL